jgi:hypothetical protein
MSGLTYFAQDGSYGDASGLTVIDTTLWIELDWEGISEVPGGKRPMVARLITETYEEAR